MALQLGKSFNRQYVLRLPFQDGFYDIGVFYNNKSSFLLFSVNQDFSQVKTKKSFQSVKVNMFKNIESSKFCETFLDLHSYKNQNLDILHQFKNINPLYTNDIRISFTETIILAKIENINATPFYDTLNLYGFSLLSFSNEFIFLIAERQNVVTKLKKKIVRSSAIQIATSSSIDLINEYYDDMQKSNIMNVEKQTTRDEIIKLS